MVAYYQEEAGRLKRCIIILQNHNACEKKYRKENDSIHENIFEMLHSNLQKYSYFTFTFSVHHFVFIVTVALI